MSAIRNEKGEIVVLSSIEDCTGYDPLMSTTHIAQLNGITNKYCFFADCERGVIGVYASDESGQLIVKDDELVREWLSGEVTILPNPQYSSVDYFE